MPRGTRFGFLILGLIKVDLDKRIYVYLRFCPFFSFPSLFGVVTPVFFFRWPENSRLFFLSRLFVVVVVNVVGTSFDAHRKRDGGEGVVAFCTVHQPNARESILFFVHKRRRLESSFKKRKCQRHHRGGEKRRVVLSDEARWIERLVGVARRRGR